MPPEDTAVAAILEKPISDLTEDDIAQLTREDCRRYLREKGMRRPSWNKSQAIQQVIMLKALLETARDSGGCSSRRRRPDDDLGGDSPLLVPEGRSFDVENSASADGKTTNLMEDLDKLDCTAGHLAVADDESAQKRPADSTNTSVGQMTIFYCGKVNVYDEVPAPKAQAILHIAASPLEFPEGQLFDDMKVAQRLPCTSRAVCTKPCQDSVAVVLPYVQAGKMSDNSLVRGEELHEENHVEGPSTRKASVQRYLEKKKDRFKSKRKAEVISCASLDMYFNYQMPSRNTFSPPQIRPSSTPARCSSMDNDSVKNVCLSTGLRNQGL